MVLNYLDCASNRTYLHLCSPWWCDRVERFLIQRLKKISYRVPVRLASKKVEKTLRRKNLHNKGPNNFFAIFYILPFCKKVKITAENLQANSTNRQPLIYFRPHANSASWFIKTRITILYLLSRSVLHKRWEISIGK